MTTKESLLTASGKSEIEGGYKVKWGSQEISFNISKKSGVIFEVSTVGGFFHSLYELRPGGSVVLHPQVTLTYDLHTLTVDINYPPLSTITAL